MSEIHVLEPSEHTAESLLATLLVRAKAGEIASVMVAVLTNDDCIATAWSGECDNDVWRSYGAVCHLSNRFYDEACRDT